eukprot:281380-Prorocentrum_minimum.AAC.5
MLGNFGHAEEVVRYDAMGAHTSLYRSPVPCGSFTSACAISKSTPNLSSFLTAGIHLEWGEVLKQADPWAHRQSSQRHRRNAASA